MRSLHSLIDPGGRSLAFHLDRLRATLDRFREQLREAVARTLGETVSDVVREAVHGLLGGPAADPPGPTYVPRDYQRRPPRWDRPDELEDEYDPDDLPLDDEDEPEAVPPLPEPPGPTWPQAMAAGLRASAWWLRRHTGRRSLLVAAGLGVLAGATVLVGGPLAIAGAGLAGSVLSLAGLDALIRSGALALTALGTP